MTKIEKAEIATHLMKLCHVTDEDVQQEIFLAALSIQEESEADFSLKLSRAMKDAIDESLSRKMRTRNPSHNDKGFSAIKKLDEMLNQGMQERDLYELLSGISDVDAEELILAFGDISPIHRREVLKPAKSGRRTVFRYL